MKCRISLIANLFLCLLLRNTAFTQVIQGNIKDAYSNGPIVNAAINLNNYSSLAISNEEGFFSINNLSNGKNHITIEKPGYEVYQETLPYNDDTLYLELKVFPISISLNSEVVVTAQRYKKKPV